MTREDKCFAWNSLPICAFHAGVTLWVQTINDTHFHALVRGEQAQVSSYRDLLLQRLSAYQRKLGRKSRIYLVADPVETRREAMSKFMYVYRNCLDFYRKLPGEYEWGSGNVYFSEHRDFYQGKRAGDLTERERRQLFHTRWSLPGNWYVRDGKILPESFLDYETVERLFGSARAFIAFLYVRKEDEAALKQSVHYRYLEQRTIDDFRSRANNISLHSYKMKLSVLPLEQRLMIAGRMLKEGTGIRSAGFAKALYLEVEDIKRLL